MPASKANGSIGAAVFERSPASVDAAAKQITVHVGDDLHHASTNIACVINNDASGWPPRWDALILRGRGAG